MSSRCDEFLWELGVEVRPRQASVLACVDLARSILMEILHDVEGGNVEQLCSILEIILPCLRLLSLSLTCVYISCILTLLISLYT